MAKKAKQKYYIVVMSMLVLLSSGIALLFLAQSSPTIFSKTFFTHDVLDWKTYPASTYKINYPPDWQADGTAAGVTIKPDAQTAYPSFRIETSPQTSALLRDKEAVFHVLHFKTTTIIMDGVSGKELSGVFPVKNVEGHMITAPLEQTTVLLEKNGTGYSITYAYEGEKINSELERTFSKILSSFRFLR